MAHEDKALKAFALELEHLMKKHEVMGFFAIASKDAAEFNIALPAWSAAQWERDPQGRIALRFKAKKEERERIEATVHGVWSLRDMAIQHAVNFSAIVAQFEERYPGAVHHTKLHDNDSFTGEDARVDL